MSVKLPALFIFFIGLSAAGVVQAQTAGVVTLRATPTSGQGSVVPVVTWSTNPVATSCRASGGWSGNKAVSGTETLASINASTNYTLTCTWGTGSANVSWVAPVANTNGTTLTDLAGFRVYYSTSPTAFSQFSALNDTAARTAVVSALAPGTWYFSVRALNSRQVESADSNIASKAVTGGSAAGTAAITVTTAPPPPPPTTPTLKTTSTTVYDVVSSGGSYALGRVVGSIAIGRPCLSTFRVGSYYKVSRNDVSFSRRSRSNVVVVRCASS